MDFVLDILKIFYEVLIMSKLLQNPVFLRIKEHKRQIKCNKGTIFPS